MTLFANIDTDGWILAECGRPDADDMVGPPAPPGLEPAEGTSLRQLAAPVLRNRPSPTARARWLDTPAPVWVESADLEALVAQGLDDVDTPADQARAAVLVKQTQSEEYKFAERDARAYQAAGYTGPPGRGVSGWAAAKYRDNWTDRDACDDILNTANRWVELLYDIRDLRLAAKEDIRHAADGAEIATLVAKFKADLALAMQGLQ